MKGRDEAHVVGVYIQHIDTDTYTYAKDEPQDMGTAQEAVLYAQYVYICTVPESFKCNKERGCKI